MIIGRQFVVLLLGLLLLGMSGCVKKKSQLPIQAKAPVEPIPSPLPPAIAEETPPPPQPAPPPEEPKVEEPKPQPAKHHKKKQEKPPPATAQTEAASTSGTGNLATARPPNEAPPDTAIAADVTSAELTQQKQTTAQLLESTEKTLSGLHDLSHDEEEMVTQIRSYLTQSRKATTDGDFERAYNLATKAHLLSDALVKK